MEKNREKQEVQWEKTYMTEKKEGGNKIIHQISAGLTSCRSTDINDVSPLEASRQIPRTDNNDLFYSWVVKRDVGVLLWLLAFLSNS